MDDRSLNLYLSRILSGISIFFYRNKKYKLKYPDINIKYEAELLADEEYENIKFNDWPTKESIVYNLIDIGLWTHNGDNQLKILEKQIDDTKVGLFDNFLNPIKLKSLRKNLDNYKRSYAKLYNTRHSFDHITIEGYCDQIKNEYMLANSIFDENNQSLSRELTSNTILLNELSSIIMNNIIDISTFKTIARHSIWRNYWSANKDRIFDTPVVNWTDEQKTLVVLTKMYDNAHESMECPPDEVFEDDDMFDGWMIKQKREQDKSRNKNRLEKSLPGKLNKAGDVFLMARSKEEAQAIYDMNDSEASHIIRERKATLNQKQTVKEQNLPDIQRNLILQSNENRKQMRK